MAVKAVHVYTCDKKGCDYRVEGPETNGDIYTIQVHKPGCFGGAEVRKSIHLCPPCYATFGNWVINGQGLSLASLEAAVIPSAADILVNVSSGDDGGKGKTWLIFKFVQWLRASGACIQIDEDLAKEISHYNAASEAAFKDYIHGKFVLLAGIQDAFKLQAGQCRKDTEEGK